MVTLIHAWKGLHSTVITLALRDDPVRKRLLDAVSIQLDEILVAKEIQGIPEELQERVTHLRRTVTKNGSYLNTIPEMDQAQVVRVVEEIVSLFHDMSVAFERSK